MATTIKDDKGLTMMTGPPPATRNHRSRPIAKSLRITDINGSYLEFDLSEEDVSVLITLLRE